MSEPCKLSTKDSPKSFEEQVMASLRYWQILGSVMYLVSCSRSNLSYNVGFLYRFMQNLGITHCQALKCVLRYLQHTMDISLTYQGNFQNRICPSTQWMDAWSTSRLDRFRLTGVVKIFGNGVKIVWNGVGLLRECVVKRGGTTGVLYQRARERNRTGYARPEIHRDTALQHRERE